MTETPPPVKYRGIKYRTRLEARWAAFFHHLRWDYTYDPLGNGSPTFLVHGGEGDPFFVEVTEATTEEEYLARGEALDASRPVVVVGVTPLPPLLDGPSALGVLRGARGSVTLAWGDLTARTPAVRAAWAKATNDVGALP
jgi:hypothetical protein